MLGMGLWEKIVIVTQGHGVAKKKGMPWSPVCLKKKNHSSTIQTRNRRDGQLEDDDGLSESGSNEREKALEPESVLKVEGK